MSRVAGKQHSAGPPSCGDEPVEGVRRRPFDVCRRRIDPGRQHLFDHLGPLDPRRVLTGQEHELEAEAGRRHRHQRVRARRVAHLECELARWGDPFVEHQVEHQPRLLELQVVDVDAECRARRRAGTVASDHPASIDGAIVAEVDPNVLAVIGETGHGDAEMRAGAEFDGPRPQRSVEPRLMEHR